MFRSVLGLMLFLALCVPAQAASVLEELPFGIVIGQTKNVEIADRGRCLENRMTTNNRCEVYDMQGKFEVHSSSNEVVNKLFFSHWKPNALPRKWRKLGLKFIDYAKTDQENPARAGTTVDTFVAIVTAEGADEVVAKVDPKDKARRIVSFYLGNYLYVAEFGVVYPPTGLSKITITEAY
ncbi:MAG: hypothetical protein ACPG1C_08750 [Alphaproteobacteria bacterium]